MKMLAILFFTISLTVLQAKEVYSLKDVMLNKQKDYYTIVIATFADTKTYTTFLENNNIEYNAIYYNFGQKNKYVKVLFGAYKTYEDAFDSLIKLNTNLLINEPFIEKVGKHINLFYKYKNEKRYE